MRAITILLSLTLLGCAADTSSIGTGVRLALPASALTAMALAARAGVPVQGAQSLERLAAPDVVVLLLLASLTGERLEGAREAGHLELARLGAHGRAAR